jgi:DNA-binding IclR family transcriptional regulator
LTLTTVERAGAVLDLFTTDHPEWGVREAASALGISKSQAYDLIASLAGIGLLQRVPGGRYRLGWRAVAMGTLAASTSSLKRAANSPMRMLAERYSATLGLAVLDRGQVVCLARRAVGPASAVADGSIAARVLAASLPWAEVVAYSAVGLALEPTDAMRDELRQIRAAGHATCDLGDGYWTVAAPIMNAGEGTLAALSMTGRLPSLFAGPDPFVQAVVVATAWVSRRLDRLEGAENGGVRDIRTALEGSSSASDDRSDEAPTRAVAEERRR